MCKNAANSCRKTALFCKDKKVPSLIYSFWQSQSEPRTLIRIPHYFAFYIEQFYMYFAFSIEHFSPFLTFFAFFAFYIEHFFAIFTFYIKQNMYLCNDKK